jgi:hypothetical protein
MSVWKSMDIWHEVILIGTDVMNSQPGELSEIWQLLDLDLA